MDTFSRDYVSFPIGGGKLQNFSMLRRLIRIFVIIGLCLFPSFQPAFSAPGYRAYAEGLVKNPPTGASFRPELEVYLADLLNSYRKSQGRKSLNYSKQANVAARAQALDMLKGNFVGHESASGYRFNQRVAAFVGDTHSVGENAARDRLPGSVDNAKAKRLFQQWIDSTGHRRNMLSNSYAEVSIGAVQFGNHLYAVQIFWKKQETQDGLSAFRTW
ncbi:uncharacterized protein YkwD [Rhodoligotrophos appendicifer]|uniref:CAP domain-containing protein n=1 Tax=Rhodoligotrophos appendicifer TaxID=987056 RepID=UPI00117DBA38|nr:CAP domain-containing protein [Rhodoligotrophos appendicifer]